MKFYRFAGAKDFVKPGTIAAILTVACIAGTGAGYWAGAHSRTVEAMRATIDYQRRQLQEKGFEIAAMQVGARQRGDCADKRIIIGYPIPKPKPQPQPQTCQQQTAGHPGYWCSDWETRELWRGGRRVR